MRSEMRSALAWRLAAGLAVGLVASLLLVGGAARAADDCPASLSAQDATAIKATIEKYRTSWLAGDADGVLGTFTDDAVLLPAQGGAPVVGREAIRKYWWPAGGPPTTITRLEITYEDVGGDCRIGYARGRDEVGWTLEDHGAAKSHGNSGTYLNVMRKRPDGSWRISHHMWDDDPRLRR